MTLDWSKEIETTEDPPRPVRVLATDCGDDYPIAVLLSREPRLFTKDGYEWLDQSGLALRNVPAKPTRHEVWISLYDDGAVVAHFSEPGTASRLGTRVECRRIVWNSDGSSVMSDAPDAPWKENSEYWKAKAEEALALLVERNDAYEVLLRRVEAMIPVVLDTITWERHYSATACDRLVHSVREYLQGEPATSDSHEAVVDAEEDKYQSYIPVKNCGTCRWGESFAVCGAKDCLGASQNYCGWEPKHD